jgi:fructose-bisphosphate aldolase class II
MRGTVVLSLAAAQRYFAPAVQPPQRFMPRTSYAGAEVYGGQVEATPVYVYPQQYQSHEQSSWGAGSYAILGAAVALAGYFGYNAVLRPATLAVMPRPLPVPQINFKGKNVPLPPSVHPGVVTGQAAVDLLKWAQEEQIAIPAVNVVTSSAINACLEAAKVAGAPMIVQFSAGGGHYYAGKGLDNNNYRASIAGCISGALHTRALAEAYGVPVLLHTDHCPKAWLEWIDGLMDANERYFEAHGEPLFSSHMLDLSEEPIPENIEICKGYLERMSKIGVILEMELGVTGGEEDGIDNSDVAQEDLYSKPEEIYQAYEELSKVPNGCFTIAAAFGNVHGVYSPGNVRLDPEILNRAQKYVADKIGAAADSKPVLFVFHGGSGSDQKDVETAIEHGVIKMNIDTDTQWSYWSGIREFEAEYRPYLQSQIGNPDGENKPNKKWYDPRQALRRAETKTVERLCQSFDDLKSTGHIIMPEDTKLDPLLPTKGGLNF